MRLLSPTTILAYHRVAAPGTDPYSLCVTPEHFASHLEALSRCASFTTLDDIDKRSPWRKRVIVTFDDGYADHLHSALPTAELFGVPLTTFITSGPLGGTFWWDRLTTLMSGRDEPEVDFSLDIGPAPLKVHLRGPERWQRGERAIHERLRLLTPTQIDNTLDSLQAILGEPRITNETRPLTVDELVKLSEHPLITIGAHTVDHQLLAGRPASSQLESISKSKSDLEKLTRRSVQHFAYPYGGRDDFDEASVQAVETAGFTTACTAIDGHAVGFCNRFRLPRRIVKDWGPDQFAGQLRRWGFG